MMEESTLEPKVFISYAWSDKEYEKLVSEFVYELNSDGIDIIWDRWNLEEGNDKYAFMEQSVNDPSVTHVLILIDPVYAKKADERKGGVGTETQIITPEVYSKTNQKKFIPVIMKRDLSGELTIPAYLKSILYFDLSNPDDRAEEYRRLVRYLFGKGDYPRPPKGRKPSWVDADKSPVHSIFSEYSSLKCDSMENQEIDLIQYLDKIKQEFLDYDKDNNLMSVDIDRFALLVKEYIPLRNKYLDLLKYAIRVKEGYKKIGDFFDDIQDAVRRTDPTINVFHAEAISIYIHEMFIYTIAYYWKYRQYPSVKYLFNKTYFSSNLAIKNFISISILSSDGIQHLDHYVCKRDNKRYYTGAGVYWMENIDLDICTKEEFAMADILCFNASMFISTYNSYRWFPITYLYEHRECFVRQIAQKLISKEYAAIMSDMLGYPTIEAFRIKYTELFNTEQRVNYGYSGAFRRPPYFFDAVKPDEIATKN